MQKYFGNISIEFYLFIHLFIYIFCGWREIIVESTYLFENTRI